MVLHLSGQVKVYKQVLIYNFSFHKQSQRKVNQMFNLPISMKNLEQAIQTQTMFDDQKLIPHLGKIIDFINKHNAQDLDLADLSNIVKQTKIVVDAKRAEQSQKVTYQSGQAPNTQKFNFQIKNFVKQAEKLQLAGIFLGESFNERIHKQLVKLAQQKFLLEGRFWGKILGIQRDYYIIQGYRQAPKQHLTLSPGSQKSGQGVNYFTYFATNDIFKGSWQQLPHLTIQQLKISRKIKKSFTGNLSNTVNSYPQFPGLQRHYLKAQLSRITHSLELSPKGIYKVHDENPKVIEYEEEVKIPDFSQMSTLQGWVHKNQMILNLGRCTHFIDPSLPEDQVEAVASQLAQKDPQMQRLRSIAEDKPAQPIQGGPESYWIQKIVGNNQTFPKQQSQNVYAVSTLKNIFWPGWITIGYMNGYCNFYIGNGMKANQSAWSTLTNDNLQVQGEQTAQFSQPNPKQLPKVEVAAQNNGQDVNQEQD